MTTPTLDTGYRWATITADDRSGFLYIVAFLSFTYSSLTFIARCFIKWRVLGIDDAAALAAQIASLVQFALLWVSLSAGLAKNFDMLTDSEYARMASTQYGNQMALYASLGLSKIAAITLTQRLFTRDMKKSWVICTMVMIILIIWTIASTLLVSVGCSPRSLAPEAASLTCPTIVARYKVVVATDIITDVVLVAVPAYLCWQLQMSFKLKLQVVAVFAFRLPLIALTSLFLTTWIRSLSIGNPGVHRAPAVMYQQAELCMSLMAATIPCLKSFLRSFDTGSGVKATFGSSNEHGSGDRTGSNPRNQQETYQLSSLERSRPATARTTLKGDDGTVRVNPRPFTSSRLIPAATKKNLSATAEQQAPTGLLGTSQGSEEERFIRKETEWEITSETVEEVHDARRRGMVRMLR